MYLGVCLCYVGVCTCLGVCLHHVGVSTCLGVCLCYVGVCECNSATVESAKTISLKDLTLKTKADVERRRKNLDFGIRLQMFDVNDGDL